MHQNSNLDQLSGAAKAFLSDTVTRNKALFGGFTMELTEDGKSGEGAGADAGAGAAADAGQQAGSGHAADAGQGAGPDTSKGGKDQVLADLARERDKRQSLEKTVADIQQASKDQMTALAKAFGIEDKAAETSGVDALTEQVKTIQDQLAATQRKATILELAAKPGQGADGKDLPAIPSEFHHLLTATDDEGLKAQAKSVAALLAATGQQNQTPGFAASAGQGQNGAGGDESSVSAQIAAAEKELQGKSPGTPEHRAARQRLMSLKSQQLFLASRQS